MNHLEILMNSLWPKELKKKSWNRCASREVKPEPDPALGVVNDVTLKRGLS